MKQADPTYNDDLSVIEGRENLWRAVLMTVINDALAGISAGIDSEQDRIRLTYEARNYILRYNRGFNEVCSLAGLEPDAVREHVAKQIAAAPLPETLCTTNKRTGRQRKPGVVSNLPAFEGTGGGSTLQESTNITFSREA